MNSFLTNNTMNIQKTVKDIARNNPKEFEVIVEQINEVSEDYNFKPVKTVSQVIYFCENCEIGEEFLLS